jgi:hypothetical protein
MRSKYYLADRLPGYLINLSLLNDRYWAASLPRKVMRCLLGRTAGRGTRQAGSLRSTQCAEWIVSPEMIERGGNPRLK